MAEYGDSLTLPPMHSRIQNDKVVVVAEEKLVVNCKVPRRVRR